MQPGDSMTFGNPSSSHLCSVCVIPIVAFPSHRPRPIPRENEVRIHIRRPIPGDERRGGSAVDDEGDARGGRGVPFTFKRAIRLRQPLQRPVAEIRGVEHLALRIEFLDRRGRAISHKRRGIGTGEELVGALCEGCDGVCRVVEGGEESSVCVE